MAFYPQPGLPWERRRLQHYLALAPTLARSVLRLSVTADRCIELPPWATMWEACRTFHSVLIQQALRPSPESLQVPLSRLPLSTLSLGPFSFSSQAR